MMGSTLYLACRDAKTGETFPNSNSCSMCKRMIINAGIKEVIVRDTQDTYRVIPVARWITNDDSLLEEEKAQAILKSEK